MLLWLELLYARAYVQESSRKGWKMDVPRSAFHSILVASTGVLVGVFKSIHNVLVAVTVLDQPGEADGDAHLGAIMIVAALSAFFFTYVRFHLQRERILRTYVVTDKGLNVFDLVSRFVVPFSLFVVYLFGDSWLWLFGTVTIVVLTNTYAGRVLKDKVGVELPAGSSHPPRWGAPSGKGDFR